jgi:hypothetical protein
MSAEGEKKVWVRLYYTISVRAVGGGIKVRKGGADLVAGKNNV